MTDTSIVHIIDDDVSLRTALSGLFRSMGIGTSTYGSVREFLDSDKRHSPGCLVLDVRLPGMSGLDFQQRFADSGVDLPVILMTGHGDIPMSVQAMKAGAVDFLTKPFRDQDMLDAVSTAMEQDRLRRAQADESSSLRALFETLSAREQQVMALVTSGKMNKQVAGVLEISEITVKIHRGSAMRKMGARTFAEFVRMADTLVLNG
jgi:FixJ family two-component response regulator